MKSLKDAVAEAPLLWDGAMGSLLYERGVFLTRSFDELNLSSPELIEGVHRDYLDAGADVIETNTFGANRAVLAKHGFADKLVEINQAGVRLARAAAKGHEAYVAGAVGPSGIRWLDATAEERASALAVIEEHLSVIAATDVDAILLETFFWTDELAEAVAIAKRLAGGRAVIAQAVFDERGLAKGAVKPRQVADQLIRAGADIVGANCGVGPGELYGVAAAMVEAGAPVSIQPNAGFPREVEGRTIYIANPEHFGVFARRMLQAGVRMVGGCCGTTPEHTRRMLGAVRMIGARPLPRRVEAGDTPSGAARDAGKAAVPIAQRSGLGARLARGEFLISCELSSPPGTDPSKALAHAKQALAGGIPHVNIADGPRATARMSNLALCTTLERETEVETILHVCCRDRNFLGLVAHLLGAHAMGLRNLVVITGDPPKIGDYPFATPVYDLDSIGLIQIVRELNHGLDPGGKALNGTTSFVIATGAEPGAVDYDRELQRLEAKKKAGAELVMTQPVYDGKLVERFLVDVKSIGLPVMIGILPLASHRNAEFLHNNVPGMKIPDDIRSRMARAGQGPAARAEGVRIAQEALGAVASRVQGTYVMPPFDRVESAIEILSVLPPSMRSGSVAARQSATSTTSDPTA